MLARSMCRRPARTPRRCGSMSSGAMPGPVSLTVKRMAGAGPRRRTIVTATSTPPLSVNLMALPIRLSSTWRSRPGSAVMIVRHVGRDMAADADALGIGARGEQLDDVVGDLAQRNRLRLELEAAGLDLGIVEQVLDQRQQRAGRRRNGADIGVLLGRQLGVGQQLGHAHDAVHRRADLVADGGEEARFRLARELGALAGVDQRRFGALARGDVAGDGAVRDRVADLVAHRQLDPGEPADAVRRADRDIGRAQAFAVGKGGVRDDADVDAELGKRAAGKVAAARLPTRSAKTRLA